MQEVTLGIALIAGLLSFLSPCVLPLVPAYVSYMGGRAVHQVALTSNGQTKQKRSMLSRVAIMTHGLAFILGFTFVFVTLGIATTAFVQYVGASAAVVTEIIARLGGVIIIFFGLHFMGALRTFFAWLRKNPDYLKRFPTLLLLIGLLTIIALWFVSQWVLTATVASLTVRLLALAILLIILGVLYVKGPLGALGRVVYQQRDALGGLPTTLIVTVLGTALIIWGFVDLIVAVPVVAVLFLLLFLGRAFDQPQDFWLALLTKLETVLYADTRAEINPTGSSSLSGSFLMGVTFSAGWTPCIGPIYGAILQLGLQGEIFAAAPLLLMYSLGLGIPFFITAALLDSAQGLLRRLQRYMGKIELFTGFLLIFVGLLVASGQLQSLSQNLSPEQTEFSINIEECGTSVAQGHLTFGQFNDCMSGTLHPVALGQGISDAFEDDETSITYVIRTNEPEIIDVDLSRIEDNFPAQVTVYDADENVLARGETITRIDERNFRILENVELPQAGRYTIVATRTDGITDPFTFRLTVRHDAGDVITSLDTPASEPTGEAIEAIASAAQEAIGLDMGNFAPNFEFVTLDGEASSLQALRGDVVLINFWGTWCGPCIREMPDLQEVYDQYADKGFIILGLATGGDTEADVIEFRNNFDLTFPLIVDEGDTVNDQYGIVNRPSTIILDQNGVIVFRHFGPVVESQIAEVLVGLLDT
ncbi:MAG: cytochrome c biogenesis protein CcdA [Anaerolineae bacterium]